MNHLSLKYTTNNIAQKMPKEYEAQVMSFHSLVIEYKKTNLDD